jgi:hypothetical protein
MIMENHIIVIVLFVPLMRKNKNAGCYPFHGGIKIATSTITITKTPYRWNNELSPAIWLLMA